MKRLSVRLKKADSSYPLVVAPLGRPFVLALKKAGFSSSRVFLITSRALQKKGHLRRVEGVLKQGGFSVESLVIPNGESQKNSGTLDRLYRTALQLGVDRKTLVLALGGGVITDLAGYFAATYMRGLSYVSLPTTLLGMVDASIGGKTGIDRNEGKNLVGAFWHPKLVWIDPAFLRTLPEREWKTGFAEVVKYGVIKDASFFQWLENQIRKNASVMTWPPASIEEILVRSAQMKAEVVSADERETPLKGGREILNFGHTTGHALEAATRYSTLTHGQAVSIGMAAAGWVSCALRLWGHQDQLRLLSLLDAVGLPIRIPRGVKASSFWKALKSDKKNVSGRLRFVLPTKIGHATVQSGIPTALLKAIYRRMSV